MSGPSAAQAPQGYQPTNQYGADQGFQSGVNTLDAGATALQNQVVPQYAGITQGVANNPYYQTAQNYAGLTSGLAGQLVAPQQFAAGQSQYGAGDALTNTAQQISAYNPMGIGAGVMANDLSQASAIGGSGYLQQAQDILGTSLGAGNAILNAGFDPQQALYNQQYQQQLDQQNAINAMNGVAGTPYGAGVSGQEANNFNLNWQNNLLSREATAAGAYGGLVNTGVSGYDSLLSGATGAQSTLQNTGTGAYTSLANSQVGNLNTLYGGAGNAYTTASGLQNQGLQALTAAGQTQNQTYLQQQQAMLDALNAQVTGTNAAYGLTQQSVADQGDYLNIGQSATANAQNAVAANNQTNQNTINSIGGALGTVASFLPW